MTVLAAWGGLSGCSSPPPAAQEKQAPAQEPKPAAANAAPPKVDPNDTRKVLVVFGDSISAGYGLQPGLSYPDDLQHLIDAEKLPWRVVNQGVSGDTTQGGVARIQAALAEKPAIVLLELGGNDGLRGIPLSATKQNLDTMIVGFKAFGAQVVLAGMSLPPNYGPDYIRDFEKIFRDLSAQHKVKLIPFLLADMITKDLRYFQQDGIHPTADGAQIVAKTAMKTLQPLLAK